MIFTFSTFSLFTLRLTDLRFLDAYKDGASGSDVVARTRQLKKRHRAPLVMPDDQQKATYRRQRRVREEEAVEEEGSDGGRSEGEEEGQIVFDQDVFAGKLRKFFWQQGPDMVHVGLAKLGKGMERSCPGVNFLVPQLYFDDIVAKQRLSEIDLEVELEMARSVGVIGDDGDEESVVD